MFDGTRPVRQAASNSFGDFVWASARLESIRLPRLVVQSRWNPIRSTTAPSGDIENERQPPDPQALTGQRRKRDGRSLTRPREAAMSIAEVPTNATSDTSVARVDMKLETVVI